MSFQFIPAPYTFDYGHITHFLLFQDNQIYMNGVRPVPTNYISCQIYYSTFIVYCELPVIFTTQT